MEKWSIKVEHFSGGNYKSKSLLAVDKLLNGSMLTSHWQFIFDGKQRSNLFRGSMAFQQK